MKQNFNFIALVTKNRTTPLEFVVETKCILSSSIYFLVHGTGLEMVWKLWPLWLGCSPKNMKRVLEMDAILSHIQTELLITFMRPRTTDNRSKLQLSFL